MACGPRVWEKSSDGKKYSVSVALGGVDSTVSSRSTCLSVEERGTVSMARYANYGSWGEMVDWDEVPAWEARVWSGSLSWAPYVVESEVEVGKFWVGEDRVCCSWHVRPEWASVDGTDVAVIVYIGSD